jgi:hypothetical protein
LIPYCLCKSDNSSTTQNSQTMELKKSACCSIFYTYKNLQTNSHQQDSLRIQEI